MSDIPALPTAQLKLIVTDAQELSKGVSIADKGGLKHLARHGGKLFAEAEGSGSAPYKTQIVHDEKGYRGRCSCMAARSRPFCKHSAALLVLWSRDGSAFAVSQAAPVEEAATGGAPRAKAKTGKVDTTALMRQGVEQTVTVVRELALSGITTMSRERVAQIRALAETLRAERLRRMSARLLELSGLLDTAATDYGSLNTEEYGEAVADLWLSARRVQKHLDGETLKPEHVETLIGKSWTKKDRVPVSGLDLVEYAFVHQVTADDFVIRESRFFDLATGEHLSEKQILPAFLAKRTAPKRSYEDFHLAGAGGGRYPGFPPIRLDLAEPGTIENLDQESLSKIEEKSLPGVAAALQALLEHRKDVFAPDALPVAIRLQSLLAEGKHLFALDESGDSLLIAGGADIELAIGSALFEARLIALFGDLLLLGAIPSLQPLALLVEQRGELKLLPLPATSAETLLEARKKRNRPAGPVRRERWIETARELAVSRAAVILGEVREELADVLSEGLGALNTRRVEGLVTRLQELNLAKPAALLTEVAARDDAGEKLDDVIRLLQVLGIGLTRLAASRKIDRSELTPSPLHPAIEVRTPEVEFTADTLVAELNSNRLHGHSRAIAIDRALRTFDETTLSTLAPALFGDGSVSALVASRFAAHPELGLATAQEILNTRAGHSRYTMRGFYSSSARVAKLTAIQVLLRLDDPRARAVLEEFRGAASVFAPQTSAAHFRRQDPALDAIVLPALGRTFKAPVTDEAALANLHAGNREDRITGLNQISTHGLRSLLPHARRLAATDPVRDVRHAAWFALASLIDVDSVPIWIQALRSRAEDDDAGRAALHALGRIGDNRAIAPLLEAFTESYKPTLVAEALQSFGIAIVPALLERIAANPELAERKAAADVFIALPMDEVSGAIGAWIDEASPEEIAPRGQSALKLAGKHLPLKEALVQAIEKRVEAAGADYKIPGDLKRALSRAKAKPKDGATA